MNVLLSLPAGVQPLQGDPRPKVEGKMQFEELLVAKPLFSAGDNSRIKN